MADAAIIFDVDGVLLELTAAEEELFFQPFARRCDASHLSRDWNSYHTRNDEDIVAEIVDREELPDADRKNIKDEYLKLLEAQLCAATLRPTPVAGAETLLNALSERAVLGIATANFREAARLRLVQAKLWDFVSDHACGAEGGGHKSEILGRTLARINLPKSRIIYIGDNVNDVEAGLKHQIHFIGFSTDPQRRHILHLAGAHRLSADHDQTARLIKTVLSA